jgi:hypothetical protein
MGTLGENPKQNRTTGGCFGLTYVPQTVLRLLRGEEEDMMGEEEDMMRMMREEEEIGEEEEEEKEEEEEIGEDEVKGREGL